MAHTNFRASQLTFQLLLFFLFCYPSFGRALDYHFSNSFRVENGLPSNHIYEICEDKKGFLWIATDNGVSRFDGKNFYNYTIKNGLPSNDVLQVAMEKDGTIWVNCYKETPAYFDEVNNRFVNFEKNDQVVRVSNTLLEYFLLPSGGIRFYGNLKYIEFQKQKVAKIDGQRSLGYIENKGFKYEVREFSSKLIKGEEFECVDLYFKNRFLRRADKIKTNLVFKRIIRNNCHFIFERNGRITRFKDFSPQLPKGTKSVVFVGERIKWCSVSDRHLCAIGVTGNIYIFDFRSLRLLRKLKTTLKINSTYIDHLNNIWIGTTDNGLQSYKKTAIEIIRMNPNVFSNNILSVFAESKHQIYAGNYQGQLLQVHSDDTLLKTVHTEFPEVWIRKIIPTQKQLFLFSDDGYFLNDQPLKTIYYQQTSIPTSIKSAFLLNKSTIIVGSINGLYALKTKDKSQIALKSPSSRFLNFQKINDSTFYTINADGLMRYHLLSQRFHTIPLEKFHKKNKPSHLVLGPGKSLWVGTVKGDLLLLQDEKVKHIIPNSAGLPENITDLLWVNQNLWIASKSGIYILNYTFKKEKISYSINKLSKSKGLSSDVINELSLCSDVVYAATNDGISVIPASIQFPKSEIIPSVISIRINNNKVPIAHKFYLPKDQRNILLEIAGAELSGHFKQFEYLINSTGKWTPLEGNILNFTLRGGENSIVLRAVDDNNNIGQAKLKIEFLVAIPFYNKIGFWALVVFALTGVFFWIYNRRKFNRQQELFQQKLELERQRNKITADLHDDIGATLSSLQINSAVANQLIDKKPNEVKEVLQKIENQAENLAEKMGDIIWSMKPGKDEFITLSMRVKNFANDIFGSTHTKYKIEANPLLDSKIQDITLRKNILLFFKEAINNAAKYSEATMVNISMDYQNNHILLEVKDNGKGFELQSTKGNGLNNMKNRMKELNGTFEIHSEPNNGTQVQAVIPFVVHP